MRLFYVSASGYPQLQKPAFARHQKHLQKSRLERPGSLAPESRDRVMVWMLVRSDKTNPDITECRPIQPTPRENSVRRTVNQQPQHQSGMIPCFACALMVDLEGIEFNTRSTAAITKCARSSSAT
jgi:hypothetical protein